MTWQEIADACGVSRQTIYDWRQEPEVREAIRILMDQHLKEELPGILGSVLEIARRGKDGDRLRAAELVTKLTGMLVDRQEVTHKPDVDGVLDRLLDDLAEEATIE
jgi:AcrR family transcriptional regulator